MVCVSVILAAKQRTAMSHPDEFYVTLVSDECRQFFKENSCISFTNALPAPIYFDQSYSVALTEIYVPPFSIDENARATMRNAKRNDLLVDEPYGVQKRKRPNETSSPSPSADQYRKTRDELAVESATQRILETTENAIESAVDSAVKIATEHLVENTVEIALQTAEIARSQNELKIKNSEAELLRTNVEELQAALQRAESELVEIKDEYEKVKEDNEEEKRRVKQLLEEAERKVSTKKQETESAQNTLKRSEQSILTLEEEQRAKEAEKMLWPAHEIRLERMDDPNDVPPYIVIL